MKTLSTFSQFQKDSRRVAGLFRNACAGLDIVSAERGGVRSPGVDVVLFLHELLYVQCGGLRSQGPDHSCSTRIIL